MAFARGWNDGSNVSSYEQAKDRYEETHPIRGRSGDIRPLGSRRRQHEQVVIVPQEEGAPAYAMHYYDTDVVTYYPNGDVLINHGGYDTTSTASFLEQYSPFSSNFSLKRLWIYNGNSREYGKYYPVPRKGILFHRDDSDGSLYPDAEYKIYREVLNKGRMAAERDALKPFLAYAKTFLALSDGWVLGETKAAVFGWTPHCDWPNGGYYPMVGYEVFKSRMDLQIYEVIRSATQENFLPVFLAVTTLPTIRTGAIDDRSVVGGELLPRGTDYRIAFSAVRDLCYQLAKRYLYRNGGYDAIVIPPPENVISGTVDI